MILFLPTRQFVLRHPDSYTLILKIWPLYVWIVVFIMTLFLLFKGLKRVDYEATWPEALWISSVCGIGIAAVAWLVCVKSGKLQQYVENKVAEDAKWEKERAKIYARYSVDVTNGVNQNGQTSNNDSNNNTDDDGKAGATSNALGDASPRPQSDDELKPNAMRVPQKSYDENDDGISGTDIDIVGKSTFNTNQNGDTSRVMLNICFVSFHAFFD